MIDENSVSTEAWVLLKGKKQDSAQTAELQYQTYTFQSPQQDEVLVEPLYGCWEGNMTHALQRQPVDVCRFRREDKVVLGNAGVARVLKTGCDATHLKEGDICLIFGNATPDPAGYMVKALAYDAPGTMGMLAKRSKVRAHNLIPLPRDTKYSLPQWAAFSLRYITAWSNWRMAWTVYRAHMSEQDRPEPIVASWGGGVAFAQMQLAQYHNCRTFMLASRDARIQELNQYKITPIDRRNFSDLDFDAQQYSSNLEYKKRYVKSEKIFLHSMQEASQADGVDIFFDHIGGPLFRATLKSVARQGVIASAGWKLGADITEVSRSTECTQRRTHVNTHYAKFQEGLDAVNFGESKGWMPPAHLPIYSWEDVPKLADDYANNSIDSYFPIYQVNPV